MLSCLKIGATGPTGRKSSGRFMAMIIHSSLAITSMNAQGKVYQSFANIAEGSIPGVVNIRTKTYVRKAPGQDLYQFFLKGRIPQSSSTTSLGSGVIVGAKGLIVTNYHVIKDADKIDILFASNRKKTSATLLGADPKTDLALLKVKTSRPLVALTLGDSSRLRIGDIVLAIGNPFGYSHTVTSGIISAKGRVVGAGPYDYFLQTDASIHPGNSGGPLIDMRGRVVGINTAVAEKGHGIGFAIPINTVRAVIRDLERHGKVIRPWLGIVGKNILSVEDIASTLHDSGVYGVIAANLIIDGPAHKAGVRIGDLLMSLDGERINDLNHLQRMLVGRKPSDSIRIKLYRRNKGIMHLSLGLEVIPSTRDLPNHDDLL